MLAALVVVGLLSYGVVAGLLPASAAERAASGRVEVVQTDPNHAQYLSRLPDLEFTRGSPTGSVIRLDDRITYQRLRAIGGAMTDSAAWLLYDKLGPATRSEAMAALFGTSGIHLGFLRVPMAASDFTVHRRPYSYDDRPAGQTDPHLRHFSIRHDLAYIIPAIREALTVNPGIWLLANPWSAPGWMKGNHAMNNRLGSGLFLDSSYEPFARYFVKFLRAYRRAHIPIAAITPQNEPENWTAYPGMEIHVGQEATLIRDYLRPALKRARLPVRIYANDSSWDGAWPRTEIREAGGLPGIAWHCYSGYPGLMSKFHKAAPHLDQIVDECSPEISPFSPSELMIVSLRNWATTVSVWNLALDPNGQPVQPPNRGCGGCTGVLTVNPRSHTFSRSLEYFQLGQVSRYVENGARRISSSHFVTYDPNSKRIVTPGVDDVAFQNPDGSKVVVVYNSGVTPARVSVSSRGHSFSYLVPVKATTTFSWRSEA